MKLNGVEVVRSKLVKSSKRPRFNYWFKTPYSEKVLCTSGAPGYKKYLKSINKSITELILDINNITFDDLPRCTICKINHVVVSNIITPEVKEYCKNCSTKYRSIMSVKTKRSIIDENGIDYLTKINRSINEKLRTTIDTKTGMTLLELRSLSNSKSQKKIALTRYLNTLKRFKNNRRYKSTELYTDSSYEIKWLDKVCDLSKISNGPPIKDYYRKRCYIPDFYIKDENIIVEIKSSYTFMKDYLINYLKLRKTLSLGYLVLLVVNHKEYSVNNKDELIMLFRKLKLRYQ